MGNAIKRGKVVEVLTKLGFKRCSVAGMPLVYMHEPTDTFVVFPHGRVTVPAARVASIRRIVTGRGVASRKRFDELLGDLKPLALVG